ncbi:unnamed protein product [Chilo suppressalis]|uniref:Carboxypeptidase n=2 Tax=Chilo suppressalis TaxID=168631 RepID=A0ABN8B6G5_CHISP|nr:unnamed protein product [Chilo suppressalis]
MYGSELYICLIVLITSTHGRIAVTDTVLPHISNEIDKDIGVAESVVNRIAGELTVNLSGGSLVNQNESTTANTENNTQPDLPTLIPVKVEDKCSNNTSDIIDNLIPNEDDSPCDRRDKDNNKVLKLTSYIEDGRTEEGRKAAEVNPDLFLGIKSYSGFFTVNKTYDSNIFFWYFPVEKKMVNETPWIIWLQGGPGASSMSGLFDEMGPFRLNQKKMLVRNPYTWLQNHSLLFIDNPVGTGCSFTNHKDGYVTDMPTYASHLYSTTKQFLLVFPELRTAPLYVAGESYAGKYVPALAMEIHKHRNFLEGDINLKGLMMGNAYIEPGMILKITETFYHFGLLVQEQLDIVQPLLDKFKSDVAENRSVKAKERWNAIIALLLFLSNQKQAYNFLRDEMTAGRYEWFMRLPEVKKALHIGDVKHSFVNITVNKKLAPDFLSNARPLVESLLNDYQVLVYCGQLDQMLPCATTSEYYRKWRWDNSSEFLNATRYPLTFKHRLVGYHKSGGGLTEVMVRGAGHMAPQDAPYTMQEMITRWTHHVALSTPTFQDLDFLLDLLRNSTDNMELIRPNILL